MITISNALTSALAVLQTQQAGHVMSLPATASKGVDLDAFSAKHGLAWWVNGKTLTLRLLPEDGK